MLYPLRESNLLVKVTNYLNPKTDLILILSCFILILSTWQLVDNIFNEPNSAFWKNKHVCKTWDKSYITMLLETNAHNTEVLWAFAMTCPKCRVVTLHLHSLCNFAKFFEWIMACRYKMFDLHVIWIALHDKTTIGAN